EADLVVAGGALVDVFTEDVHEGWGLAIADGRIAFVGPDAEVAARAGSRTERVELDGDLVAPGLVEGHTHLTRIGVAETAELQVRAGVTTTVVESMEAAVVLGLEGVRALLATAEAAPGRLLFTASGLVICATADHEAIDAADALARLRLGLHTELRHGATRQDLPAMVALWRDRRLDGGRLSLVTDGLEPDILARGDSLNWVVEQAVELGLPL